MISESTICRRCLASLAAVLAVLAAGAAQAVEHVQFQRDGEQITISGRVVVESQDGGLMLMTSAGRLWAVQPEELVERRGDSEPFRHLTAKELAAELLEEMPAGFQIHTTAHYIFCYNTSPAYVQWCGALYERLYRAFTNYWDRRGVKLHEPEMPLVAMVFNSKASYTRYAARDVGEAAARVITFGYFSQGTNRVTMYDLTGADGVRAGGRLSTAARINRVLSQPGAEFNVATIIHEATHQLAYNCGMHTRNADIPLWLSEGMANFFETPDLKSSKGWRNVGSVNERRLRDFRRYLGQRPPGSLQSLVADDSRFRHTRTAGDAYAEAWALNYFLIRTRPKPFVAYLKQLAEKGPSVFDTPRERMQLFQEVFGADLVQFDRDFIRYISRLK